MINKNTMMKRILVAALVVGSAMSQSWAQVYAPELKIKNTDGKIGLGTIPDADIHLRGNSIRLDNSNGLSHSWLPYHNGNIYLTADKDKGGDGSIFFRTFSESENYTTRMTIKENGDVNLSGLGIVNEVNPAVETSWLFYKGGIDRQIGFTLTNDGKTKAQIKLWEGNLHEPHISFSTANRSSDNITERMRINKYGQVGIGTPSPDELLSVNGNASKVGGGSWKTYSDERLKKNIQNFESGIDVIKKLRPVTFNYNGINNLPTEEQQIGVIAQELQELAPYMVSTSTGQDSVEYLSVNPSAFDYILINAVKEQQAMIEKLQAELATLREELEK